MAEEGQTVGELTCAICMQSLRDPVQLPCQHSYCSGCITMFAEKSKPKGTPESSAHQGEDDWLIACPTCRAPTHLRIKRVAGLSVTTSAGGTVEKVGSKVKLEESESFCSMCDEGDEKKAVKFCGDCDTFYCEDCLTYHPMKGKFRHHQLISVQEYILQRHEESVVKTEEEDQELCSAHKKALILYCGACQQLCCLDCTSEHCEHPMSNKLSAYRKLKEPCVKTTSDCKEQKHKISGFVSEMEDLLGVIQENTVGKRTEIEQCYQRDLQVINEWRRRALEVVDKRNSTLAIPLKTGITELRQKIAEMELMIQESETLPTSLTKTFLQMSRELSSRMDQEQTVTSLYMKNQQETRKRLEEDLKRNPAVPIYHKVDLKKISVPVINFETSDSGLVIVNKGSMVRLKDQPAKWLDAYIDTSFQTGCHFWQLRITIKPSSLQPKKATCIFKAGLTQEGCSFYDEPGEECWYIGIGKCEDEFHFFCLCGDVDESYEKWGRLQETYILGFFLECDTQTLTVVDCERNAKVLTMDNVDIDEPLEAMVAFHGRFMEFAAARLVTGNSVLPPSVLWSTL